MYGEALYTHFRNFLYGQWHCHGNLVIGKRKVLEDYFDFLIETFTVLKTKLNIQNYFDKTEILDIINKLVKLRENGETSATLDMCAVNEKQNILLKSQLKKLFSMIKI